MNPWAGLSDNYQTDWVIALNKLCIHDDLLEQDKQINAYKFCCPIFITNQFGTSIADENDLIAGTDQPPKIRSGTLTFVRFKGEIYGLTCRHVLDELEKANKSQLARQNELLGDDAQFPPEAQFHFYFPKNSTQTHINSVFHKAPGDEFTGDCPDVAIARISSSTFQQIGRAAIDLTHDFSSEDLDDPVLGAIATGYPEQKRQTKEVNNLVRNLAVSTVIAVAPIDRMSESKLSLYAELKEEPDADNLSGMSGGPILWSREHRWGLLGIVKEGRDMKRREPPAGQEAIVDSHVIWIDGERLQREKLVNWLETLPRTDFLPNLSKRMILPKG